MLLYSGLLARATQVALAPRPARAERIVEGLDVEDLLTMHMTLERMRCVIERQRKLHPVCGLEVAGWSPVVGVRSHVAQRAFLIPAVPAVETYMWMYSSNVCVQKKTNRSMTYLGPPEG